MTKFKSEENQKLGRLEAIHRHKHNYFNYQEEKTSDVT
jgi:hypothetical protein